MPRAVPIARRFSRRLIGRARFSASAFTASVTIRASALRADDALDDTTLAELRKKLDKLDWALPVMRVIRDNPRVVSTELAPQVGMERPEFKLNVRKLKALGLTESFSPGYELSPRGAAVLRALDT